MVYCVCGIYVLVVLVLSKQEDSGSIRYVLSPYMLLMRTMAATSAPPDVRAYIVVPPCVAGAGHPRSDTGTPHALP